MNEVRFWVSGIPQPGGSKRVFINRKTGKPIVTDASRHNKDWRASVSLAAQSAMGELQIMMGAVSVRMEFYFPHRKGHYGAGKNAYKLRAGAPRWPAVRPDLLKLARSTEDALTGIVWRDDAQIVQEVLEKRYGDQPGARIVVQELHAASAGVDGRSSDE